MVIQNALGSDSSAAVSKERCGLKWLPNERVPISPGGEEQGSSPGRRERAQKLNRTLLYEDGNIF